MTGIKGITWEQKYGKIKADEIKVKISQKLKGRQCTWNTHMPKEMREKLSALFKGKPRSEIIREKISKTMLTKTGGHSRPYGRKLALGNIPNECSVCGTKTDLEVHHKNNEFKNNALENLELLCVVCHQTFHWFSLMTDQQVSLFLKRMGKA